jgi:hypothetical protein
MFFITRGYIHGYKWLESGVPKNGAWESDNRLTIDRRLNAINWATLRQYWNQWTAIFFPTTSGVSDQRRCRNLYLEPTERGWN